MRKYIFICRSGLRVRDPLGLMVYYLYISLYLSYTKADPSARNSLELPPQLAITFLQLSIPAVRVMHLIGREPNLGFWTLTLALPD
jgi:hypothetical protein